MLKKEIRNKIFSQNAFNLLILFLALGMGIYFNWRTMETVIFLIFIGTLIRPVSGWILAVPGLFFLVSTPLLLIINKEPLAEIWAVYAFYFFALTAISGIREIKKEF